MPASSNGHLRRCSFCGIYVHKDEAVKASIPKPKKRQAWKCLRCLENTNDAKEERRQKLMRLQEEAVAKFQEMVRSGNAIQVAEEPQHETARVA